MLCCVCVVWRRVVSHHILYFIILFMCGFELSKDILTLKSFRRNGIVIASLVTVKFIKTCQKQWWILLKRSLYRPPNQAVTQYNNAESGCFCGVNNKCCIPVGWSVVAVVGHDIENKVVVTIYTHTMCLFRGQIWPIITNARNRVVLGHDSLFRDLHKKHDFC